MKTVKVVKRNDQDPNPWLVSDLPFTVHDEFTGHDGELAFIIAPFGCRKEYLEDQKHQIPANHTLPFDWNEPIIDMGETKK